MDNVQELVEKIKGLGNEAIKKAYKNLEEEYSKVIKSEKEAKINQSFKEKGITCLKCESYRCVKNGKRNNRQKYLCKDCGSSFDALRNHFTFRSRLKNSQWELLLFFATLGLSSRNIAKGIKVSTLTAWKNRQKIMNSKELNNSQLKYRKLKGEIQIDETFIKEIHKGNFNDKDDIRRQYINSDSRDTQTCIVTAIDQNGHIYIKATKTKRLQKEFCTKELTNDLIKENSTLITDMQTLYEFVAKQTKCKIEAYKVTANKHKAYEALKRVSQLHSNLKEFMTHYHGIGFTNIQQYLELWKWQYQHLTLSKEQQFEELYFSC